MSKTKLSSSRLWGVLAVAGLCLLFFIWLGWGMNTAPEANTITTPLNIQP